MSDKEKAMKVHVNHRGFIPEGNPLDGNFDGWSWHAWSGPYIGYGPSQERAVENLIEKMANGSTLATEVCVPYEMVIVESEWQGESHEP